MTDKHTYTIIAYMPDGHTSCRGCIMDQWGSSFEAKSFSDLDQAAHYYARFRHANETKKDDIGSWELNLLYDGVPVQTDSDIGDETDYDANSEPMDVFHSKFIRAVEAKMVLLLNLAADAKAEALRVEQLRNEETEAKAKESRRIVFEQLKKEFGS